MSAFGSQPTGKDAVRRDSQVGGSSILTSVGRKRNPQDFLNNPKITSMKYIIHPTKLKPELLIGCDVKVFIYFLGWDIKNFF